MAKKVARKDIIRRALDSKLTWIVPLIIVSVVAVVFIVLYALALKEDIDALRTNTNLQLEIMEDSLEIAASIHSLTERQVEISEALLELAQKQDQQTDELLQLARELRDIAAATLQEAREINQRTQPLDHLEQLNNLQTTLSNLDASINELQTGL